jgi:protocatechuate 3,4-dioxygenase beta subunit
VTTAVMLVLSAGMAQIQPAPPPPPPSPMGQPRDVVRRPDPVGTGMIRGRVVAGDTGNPVRRAQVSLQAISSPTQPPAMTTGSTTTGTTTTTRTMTAPTGATINIAAPNTIRPRSVTTDSQGMFEFTGLPAGGYRLQANAGQYSAGYLGIAYGAKRPSGVGADQGATIELADGQRFDKATIALPRGAVIAGRVTDENGDPMARVQVYTLFYAPGSTRGSRQGSGAQTDDLGQFRLYGLQSGDYVVVAEARGPTFVPPNAPPETEEDKIGFMTTYFPGTPDESSAQRVRTKTGAESPGVEIRMAMGRLFRLSGFVADSQGRAAARVNGQLYKRTSSGLVSSFGFNTDDQGRFQMRNIPPGTYRLIARGQQERPPASSQPPESGELGILGVTVNADLENLMVMMTPGVTVTGQVAFENGPPQLPPGQQSFQMRVTGMSGDPENNVGLPGPQAALVTPDLTFTMRGLHGELLLRSSGPGMFLKAVTAGGRDITDTPHEFKSGEQVTLVMTTRASTVEGIVSDGSGKPVTDAAILIFSEDKDTWRMNATRTRRGFVDPTGKFRVAGLLPGRYYAIAAPRERLNISSMSATAELFEQRAKEATAFVVGEDEQRQVDLKLSAGSGGH